MSVDSIYSHMCFSKRGLSVRSYAFSSNRFLDIVSVPLVLAKIQLYIILFKKTITPRPRIYSLQSCLFIEVVLTMEIAVQLHKDCTVMQLCIF